MSIFKYCFLQGAETWWGGDLEVDGICVLEEPMVWLDDGSLSIKNFKKIK